MRSPLSLLSRLNSPMSLCLSPSGKNLHRMKQETEGKVDLHFLILSSPYISLHILPHGRTVIYQLTHTLHSSYFAAELYLFYYRRRNCSSERQKREERALPYLQDCTAKKRWYISHPTWHKIYKHYPYELFPNVTNQPLLLLLQKLFYCQGSVTAVALRATSRSSKTNLLRVCNE